MALSNRDMALIVGGIIAIFAFGGPTLGLSTMVGAMMIAMAFL